MPSGRKRSATTGEWMYVFEPDVATSVLYVKVILRINCVLIHFTRTRTDLSKKAGKQKPLARRRLRSMPDDACPSCGTKMVEKRGALRLPVNGEEVSCLLLFT
jgi:hypothetical protein